ncbi:MAG: hypothetical protein Kow0089_18580 [Desulfobulbaceae bacterium]
MSGDTKKKILVVGATGFLGPAIVEEFSLAGYHVVCGVRNLESAARQLRFPNVEFLKVNMNEDLNPNTWLERLRRFRIDGVVNNVGIANEFGDQSMENVNVNAPLALFEAVTFYCQENIDADRQPQNVTVIQISTTGVDWPDCDAYRYPKSKKMIDESLLETTGLNFIIVRPNIIYEPGRGHLLLEHIVRLPVLTYIGTTEIQPIHCRELAIGVVRLMENPFRAACSVLLATGPEVLTWKQVFLKVSEALGIRHGILFRVPLLVGQFFTNLIQYMPAALLSRLGILSKLDNDTIEMMTKGSTGDNREWLEKTALEPIRISDAYSHFADSPEAYEAFIRSIREKRVPYS